MAFRVIWILLLEVLNVLIRFNDCLRHTYSSKYYDPVKAHEYYMQTRELKGRRSTTALSDEGKEKWSYVQDSIKTEKVNAVTEIKQTKERDIKTFRENATTFRKSISDSLKKILASITTDTTSKREKESSLLKEKLEEISENAKKKKKIFQTSHPLLLLSKKQS